MCGCEVCALPLPPKTGKRGPAPTVHRGCSLLNSRLGTWGDALSAVTWASDDARRAARSSIMGLVNRHLMRPKLAADAPQLVSEAQDVAEVQDGPQKRAVRPVTGCCHLCGVTVVQSGKGRPAVFCSEGCKRATQALEDVARNLPPVWGNRGAAVNVRQRLLEVVNTSLQAGNAKR